MWLWERLEGFVGDNPALFIALTVSAGLLCVAAIVSILLEGKGVYAACSAIVGGGFALVILIGKAQERAVAYGLAGLAVFGGVVYLIVYTIVTARQKVKERKRRRAEEGRRLQYTLPERDNTYIRARLNTVLQVPETEENYRNNSHGEPARLEYARKLLAKVKEAPLTAAEWLQTEEIGKLFALYLKKERWSAEDLRTVNDTFSCLLKLSAKYSVAV